MKTFFFPNFPNPKSKQNKNIYKQKPLKKTKQKNQISQIPTPLLQINQYQSHFYPLPNKKILLHP